MIGWSGSGTQASKQLQVNAPDRSRLFGDLRQRLRHNQGFALATLNLDHVVKLRQSPEFHEAYVSHTHVTADGNPIVWLLGLAGQRVALIPGSELVVPVTEIAASLRVPVALVGATASTLKLAAERLQECIPELEVVLQMAPSMGFNPTGPEADATIEAIRESGAGLCFIALGAPKQEILAAQAHAMLPNIGFVSIGAGLDFIAGSQNRAPRLVRMLAAEWLWRLGSNPRRLAARYGNCLCLLPTLAVDALRARWKRV